MTLLALLLTSMVSLVGLAWSSFRLYFAVSCVVSLGLAVALLVRDKQPPRDRVTDGYDPCPRCGSLAVERAADEIRYIPSRSEEHTSELQSRENLVCRLLLEKKK